MPGVRTAIPSGYTAGGSSARDERHRNMTDDDPKAILAYLRTILPVRNKVPDPLPPPETRAK